MTVLYREGGAGSTPINVLSLAVTDRGLVGTVQMRSKELHQLMSIHSRPDSTLAAAVLGFFVITLDAVVVNVALPSIRRDFGGGMSGLQWVVDGYTLMFAALLLTAGALSDRIGARRAFGAAPEAIVLTAAARAAATRLDAAVIAS